MLERKVYCERSILIKRLMEAPDMCYKNQLVDRWNHYRKNLITRENLFLMMAENGEIIANDLESNFAKWPIDSKWYYDNNSYQQEVELIKTYLDLRLKDLDHYFRYLIVERSTIPL